MDSVTVTVARFDPEKEDKPENISYTVPFTEKMRVLDALMHIQEHFDASLTFQKSCRAGQCGSCAVMVNKKPVLACKEEIKDNILVEPLPVFPVIRDLVVDFEKAYLRLDRLLPSLHFKQKSSEAVNEDTVNSVYNMKKCIECFACIGACPACNSFWDDFLGPMYFTKIGRFQYDSRDKHSRIDLAAEGGIFNCSICHACKEACPQDIALPGDAIEKLRALVVEKGLGPLSGHKAFLERIKSSKKSVDIQDTPFLSTDSEFLVFDPETPAYHTVGFFLGCMLDRRLQQVAKDVITVLTKNATKVVIPVNQLCCGSPLFRTGQLDIVKDLVFKNAELFAQTDVDCIITACPGCGMTLKNDHARIYKEERGIPYPFKVYDINEFLVEHVKFNFDDLTPLSYDVTYHDPCHLKRAQNIMSQPRELLKSIPALSLTEMEQADACCGAGGGLRAGNSEASFKMGKPKVKGIHNTGCPIVATSCPFCTYQLKDLLEQSHSKVKVKYVASLLAESYEGR